MRNFLLSVLMIIGHPVWGEGLPAAAYQVSSLKGGALTVAVVQVLETEEVSLLNRLDRLSEGDLDRVMVISSKDDQPTGAFKRLDGDGRLKKIFIPTSDSDVSNKRTSSRKFASLSTEDLQKAGTLIAVTGTGLFSALFYFTSSVESATAATLVTALFQALNFRYPQLFWGALHRSGVATQRLATSLAPELFLSGRIAYEVGKIPTAFMYNFLTQALFTAAISFGGSEGEPNLDLNQIASLAAIGLFTSSSWEFFFANLHSRVDDPELSKMALILKYSKQIFFMALSPFYYLPSTHNTALAISFSFGTLGLGANFFAAPFVNTAKRILSHIERASDVRIGFSKSINKSWRRTKSAIKFRKSAGCEAMLE